MTARCQKQNKKTPLTHSCCTQRCELGSTLPPRNLSFPLYFPDDFLKGTLFTGFVFQVNLFFLLVLLVLFLFYDPVITSVWG